MRVYVNSEKDSNNEINRSIKRQVLKYNGDTFVFKYLLSCTAATIAETSF